MSLIEKYPQEIKDILAKYPPEQKRSAVMPLLYLAQREGGYTTTGSHEGNRRDAGHICYRCRFDRRILYSVSR